MGKHRHRLSGAVLTAIFVAAAVGGSGCHSTSGSPSPKDNTYLSEVHDADPNVGSVRSDTQLVRLGHAVCDDFSAGASYVEVADRLSTEQGNHPLPSADLGAVITSAADTYCPQYRSRVSG